MNGHLRNSSAKALRIYILAAAAAAAKSLQSCLTLYGPIDGSPIGSSVPGILQARTLEWVAISFSSAWKWKLKVKSLSCVRLCATPWTAAYQALPSMGFSRQEYWSGCHCLLLYILEEQEKVQCVWATEMNGEWSEQEKAKVQPTESLNFILKSWEDFKEEGAFFFLKIILYFLWRMHRSSPEWRQENQVGESSHSSGEKWWWLALSKRMGSGLMLNKLGRLCPLVWLMDWFLGVRKRKEFRRTPGLLGSMMPLWKWGHWGEN